MLFPAGSPREGLPPSSPLPPAVGFSGISGCQDQISPAQVLDCEEPQVLKHLGCLVGEGVKSARGETAIPGYSDHTRNMFGTSLHTSYCKQTIALEAAERMQ